MPPYLGKVRPEGGKEALVPRQLLLAGPGHNRHGPGYRRPPLSPPPLALFLLMKVA